jgi:hypothetical protein
MSLAAHSFQGLLALAEESTPAAQSAVLAPNGPEEPSRVIPAHGAPAVLGWLWIAPTVLLALFIPVLDFCLMGLLVAGPVISAYHDAFEASSDFQLPPDGPSHDGHKID